MTPVEIQQLVKRQRYLTIKQAAEIAGVSIDFLYRRIGKPQGPPYRKRGRVYRLPTYEFLMWSEQPETA